MKKNYLSALLTALMLSSPVSWAQEKMSKDNTSVANYKLDATKTVVAQRAELIKTYGLTNALSMGWYTGGVATAELRDVWNNYITMSNYLSEKLNRLVVLETDKNDLEIAVDAYKSMDIVYTSALMGGELIKAGWRPIVGRSEDLAGVIIANINTVVEKPEDLKKLKIVGSFGATTFSFTRFSLIKDGVYKSEELKDDKVDDNFSSSNLKQNDLLEFLKNKKVDGVIVRDTVAAKLMKDNPNAYKIIYTAIKAPGHIVYVNKSVTKEEALIVKKAFLDLTTQVPAYKTILSGLDGYKPVDLTPFREVNEDTIKNAYEVYKLEGGKSFAKK